MRATEHGQASDRAQALYILAHHGSQASKTRIGRRRARVEGDGQRAEHQTGEPEGRPLPWLVGDQGPPECHALRKIAGLGNLIAAGDGAYPVAPVSAAIIDTLAADDEFAIVSTTSTRPRFCLGPLRRPLAQCYQLSRDPRQPGAATAPAAPSEAP